MVLAYLAAGIAAVAVLLLAASGPAYRIELLSLSNAFMLLRWSAYLGVAAVLVGAIAGGWAYRRRALAGLALSVASLLMGLAAFGIPYLWQRRAQSVPPIHDITTDLQNPPAFDAVVPLRADAPNSLERPPQLAEQQRAGYPELAPITLAAPPDQAFDRALAVAQDEGWQIVTADKASGRIEATDTTEWFGFKDYVVVRLTPWGSGTRVYVRSVSRVGRSDVGTNARRIRRFLEQLQAE